MNPSAVRVHRRTLLKAAGLAATLAAPAWAQTAFPSKPLRIIVPLQAGGVADAIVRIIAERLQTTLKQTVVVDNKPGGVYQIGMQALTSAPADGHTLMHLNVSMLAVQAALKKLDLLKQVEPITEAGFGPAVMFISAKAPFATFAEMLAWGKANPGKINFASQGAGSLEHLLSHAALAAGSIQGVNVPFKGGPDAMVAMVQGDVHVLSTILQVGKPFADKGQLRIVGSYSENRLPGLPDVPTFKELGVAAPAMSYWGGFAAPAGTPAPVIETLRREIAAALAFPEVQERIAVAGTTPSSSESPAAFRQKIVTDLEWMERAVRGAGLNLS